MSKRKRKRLSEFAAGLNRKLPRSEKWFWQEWERVGMRHEEDRPNEVFARYIPDIVNRKYQYIIEVDGSIHEKKREKNRDEKKNRAYAKAGYEVFRIQAYNYEQLGLLMDIIEMRRRELDRLFKAKGPKTIRRPANKLLQ